MYERTYHKTVLKQEEKDVDKKNSRGKAGALREWNWKLIIGIVSAVILLVGSVLLIRAPRLQVRTIEVNGAHVADPGDITEFVNSQLQGNKLFILPRSSIFLAPEHAIEKALKAQFPRLQTVEVDRKNFSTLSINVTEFQGMYLWCTADADCYFMDQNGIAFATAPYFSGTAYPKIFNGTASTLPFQAVTADQLTMVSLLLSRLPSLGIDPAEFHFVSDHELDVDFNHDGHQAQLIFDPTSNTADALQVLFTGLRTNPLAGKFRDASQVLQYIDLRFSNRIVYKFQ